MTLYVNTVSGATWRVVYEGAGINGLREAIDRGHVLDAAIDFSGGPEAYRAKVQFAPQHVETIEERLPA